MSTSCRSSPTSEPTSPTANRSERGQEDQSRISSNAEDQPERTSLRFGAHRIDFDSSGSHPVQGCCNRSREAAEEGRIRLGFEPRDQCRRLGDGLLRLRDHEASSALPCQGQPLQGSSCWPSASRSRSNSYLPRWPT